MNHLVRLIVATLFLTCISGKANSVENDAPLDLPTKLFKVNDSFKSANLGKDILYLKDTDGSISIEQILSDKTLNWQVVKDEAPNFGVDPSNFWFKTSIHFDKQASDGYLVEIAYPVLDFIDLYVFQNGIMKKAFHTGDRLSFNSRSLEHRNFLFPLPSLEIDLPVDIYVRTQTAGAMQVPLFIWEQKAFWEQDQYQLMAHTFFFAILVTLALYNFMLFVSLRDNAYLLYVLYIISLTISQLSLRGLNYQLLVPDYPIINERMLLSSIGVAIIFAGLFARKFMALPRTSPNLNKIMLCIVALALIQAIGGIFMPYSLNVKMGILLTAISCPTLLIVGLIQWLKGYKIARFFTLAWTVYLIGQFALTLSKFGIIPRTTWIEHGPEIGAGLEVILLSFALADRMNEERRKRHIAQENALLHERSAREAQQRSLTIQNQANEELESRVNARTLELSETLEQLSEVNEKLHALSTLDGLTKVGNRRSFDNVLDREWRRCMRDQVELSLLLLDADHFKQINDQYGHQTGDECLKHIADILSESVKRPADGIARYGGEEFAVVLPNTSEEGAKIIAERIRSSIETDTLTFEGQKILFTISIGLASLKPNVNQSFNQTSLIEKADKALYLAKKEGRNRVCAYT